MRRQSPVSIVITMRNSVSTIRSTLETTAAQDYPIAEILVLDNVSSDGSVAVVEDFARTSPVPVRLIRMAENRGLSASFNRGVDEATAEVAVMMHSDGSLPSTGELAKLLGPLVDAPETVATFPRILMPYDLWNSYPFWQRVLFARQVGKSYQTFSCKFVAVRRAVYQRIGGLDEELFCDRVGYGGEDSDLHMRLEREGLVVGTEAQVIHLHAIGVAYGPRGYIFQRKVLGLTYGCILYLHGRKLPSWKPLLIKPLLVPLPFLPHLHLAGIGVLLLFSALYNRTVYLHALKRGEARALLLPLVDIALVYREVAWMVQGWFSTRRILRARARARRVIETGST